MKFYIRTTKAEGSANLYTDIQRKGIKCKVSTPIAVSIKEWNKAQASSANYAQFLKAHKDISTKMDNVQSAIENALLEGVKDRATIAKVVEQVFYQEERDRVDAANAALEAERTRIANSPLNYIANLIEGMKEGRRLTDGERYKDNTIQTIEGLYNHLVPFVKRTPFDWCDVTKQLVDKFVCHLTREGLMPSTINAHLRVFRMAFNMAYQEGVHTNIKGTKAFTQIKVKEDDVRKEIYLNADELDALYRLPIMGRLAKVRDTFLVGCYTCQRYSDYSKIERGDFSLTAKGTKVVRIIQQKTGTSVTIPVLNDNLLRIMERYNYNLPRIDESLFNIRIKEIMKMLADSVPSLNNLERTTLSKDERKKEKEGVVTYQRDEAGNVVKPRYELVSSHTARRSGITNLYLTGKFDTLSIMKVSGHKSESSFMRYIRVTNDEYADRIASAYTSDTKAAETL